MGEFLRFCRLLTRERFGCISRAIIIRAMKFRTCIARYIVQQRAKFQHDRCRNNVFSLRKYRFSKQKSRRLRGKSHFIAEAWHWSQKKPRTPWKPEKIFEGDPGTFPRVIVIGRAILPMFKVLYLRPWWADFDWQYFPGALPSVGVFRRRNRASARKSLFAWGCPMLRFWIFISLPL